MKLTLAIRSLLLCALMFAPAVMRADDSSPLIGGGEIGVRVEMRNGPGAISFPNPIPEPSSVALLALGAAAVCVIRRNTQGRAKPRA